MDDKRVIESVLRRALAVQEVYLEIKEPDLPNTYIYRKYIKPRFHISERTFYRYLNRNVKRELRLLENEANETATITTD
jgi:hypothetical protein